MKKILFVTGSRSEYGLLKNLVNLFAKEKNYECHLLITGNHLSKRYGNSKDRIQKIQKIKLHFLDLKIKDSKIMNIIEAMSLSLKMCGQLFSKLNLDQIIVIGDRFESYTAAVAAKLNNIKIVHFHGGETTTGAYDNYWRHSISLMSDLHFVANKKYKIRVSKIIDSKKNIYCVGGLGVDNIKGVKFKDKDQLANEFSFSFNRHNIVIVFHSETNHALTNTSNFKTIIKACKKIRNTNFFISYPGYDLGSDEIIEEIRKIKSRNFFVFKNLGEHNFLSLVKTCDCIIGNSSSGIIEAPYLRTQTINLGDRQKGRIKDKSIYDCNFEVNEIIHKINRIINLNINKKLPYPGNIYGKGHVAKKAFEIIKNGK